MMGCRSRVTEPFMSDQQDDRTWTFYQALSDEEGNPCPFFLTLQEAQEYCETMNTEKVNNYRVAFIYR